MGTESKVQHPDLVAYLRGKSNPAIDSTIQTLKEYHPVYQHFFALIEDICQLSPLDFFRPPTIDTLSFNDLEDLLIRLTGGTASPEERQRFIDLLVSSPGFYRRVLIKLSQAIPQPVMEEMPEFAGEFARLHSDEELLRAAGIIKNGTQTPGTEPGRGWLVNIIGFGQNIFDFFRPRRPVYAGLATAIAAVILVFAGVSMTRVPYGAHWETPPLDQISSLRGNGSASSLRAENNDPRRILQLHFNWIDQDVRKEDYAGAVEKLASPGAQTAARSLEEWLENPSRNGSGADPARLAETQGLLQDYYFYRGAAHLGNYRNHKKSLLQIADRKELGEAARALSKAEALAAAYSIDTGGRELYYLGLTFAMEGKKDAARRELAKISENSGYFPKAQALLKDLHYMAAPGS